MGLPTPSTLLPDRNKSIPHKSPQPKPTGNKSTQNKFSDGQLKIHVFVDDEKAGMKRTININVDKTNGMM